jgi:hypothetical protein
MRRTLDLPLCPPPQLRTYPMCGTGCAAGASPAARRGRRPPFPRKPLPVWYRTKFKARDPFALFGPTHERQPSPRVRVSDLVARASADVGPRRAMHCSSRARDFFVLFSCARRARADAYTPRLFSAHAPENCALRPRVRRILTVDAAGVCLNPLAAVQAASIQIHIRPV